MKLSHKKGYFYFGVGSLFLVLIVIFVVIALIMPDLGTKITLALKELFSSVKG